SVFGGVDFLVGPVDPDPQNFDKHPTAVWNLINGRFRQIRHVHAVGFSWEHTNRFHSYLSLFDYMNSVGYCDCWFGFRSCARTFAGLSALLHQLGDDAGPSGLMAGSYPSTGIPVEVFVKQDEVTPLRICLELFEIREYRPAALVVLKKDTGHAA